jgi:hypothetical protein
MENPQELTQGQAVNVLIQAARIAQSKGAFTLEDAELVSKAIRVFVPTNQSQDGTDPVMNAEPESEAIQPVVEKA